MQPRDPSAAFVPRAHAQSGVGIFHPSDARSRTRAAPQTHATSARPHARRFSRLGHLLALVCLFVSPAGFCAANPALSGDAVEAWISAFAEDYGQRGAEALWSRLDQPRLAQRTAELDRLGDKLKSRRAAFIRQKLSSDRASYADFTLLTVGRRTDAGDHWTVLTHYNSDAGTFFYRRLRLEADPQGAALLADWADLPCDMDISEVVATNVLLQMREIGEEGVLSAARRDELAFFRDNPQKLLQLHLAFRPGSTQLNSLRAALSDLPPAAKYGAVAREARTQWFVLVPSGSIASEVSEIVGPAEQDPLRGLLLFRAGIRGEHPNLGLEGTGLLSAQLGEDVMWRSERSSLLDHAGRMEEAVEFARETAELFPTMFVAHVHHLAALRRAGRMDEASRREKELSAMLGAESTRDIAKRAADFAKEQADRENRARSADYRTVRAAPPPPPPATKISLPSRAPIDVQSFNTPPIRLTLPLGADAPPLPAPDQPK